MGKDEDMQDDSPIWAGEASRSLFEEQAAEIARLTAEIAEAEKRGRLAALEEASNWHKRSSTEQEVFARRLLDDDRDRAILLHAAGLHRACAEVMKILANGANLPVREDAA